MDGSAVLVVVTGQYQIRAPLHYIVDSGFNLPIESLLGLVPSNGKILPMALGLVPKPLKAL